MARTYSWQHRKKREALEPVMATTGAACARCKRWIQPGEPWDLGHVDGQPHRHQGPEHRACNRGAPSKRRAVENARRAGATGGERRWSRHWFGGFDSRCPSCRQLGHACEAVTTTAEEG